MKVKGSALKARMQYVLDHGGEPAVTRLLATLGSEARALGTDGFLVNEWYPYTVFVELCETIDRLHGKGDLTLCHELGRYACDANLTTLYRIFFKIGNIQFIIRRAALAWRVTYDAGDMKILEEGRHHVVARIEGVPQPTRAHCLSVRGWMERAGEISGATDVASTETCRALGHPHCDLRLTWK
jgi:hypothetical protein